MNGYIGEVRLFAGNFAPRSWAYCHGQLMPIAQNTALFSILGTIYGGDGRSTFKLPDLQGRTAIGVGRGPGLSTIQIGQRTGIEEITLTLSELASHNHSLVLSDATFTLAPGAGNTTDAMNNAIASSTSGGTPFIDAVPNPAIKFEGTPVVATVALGDTGGNQAYDNMQPFLGLNYIICLQGVYPTRS